MANRSNDAFYLLHILKKVIRFESSAPAKLTGANCDFMKKPKRNDDLRPHYDFASMKGGVRGKYAKQYSEGTNIVLLEPDIAEAFPNDAAVNQALRGILSTTRAVRSTGGLAEKSLRPASERRARRSKRA